MDPTPDAVSNADPAQAEWERTQAVGLDDLPHSEAQPETQGDDPLSAELGDDGEGDLLPEDL